MSDLTILSEQLRVAPLSQIADLIRRDWGNRVSPHALPYIRAMLSLPTDTSTYGADSAKEIVLYFLANTAGWRGAVAKAVKTELRTRFSIK